MGQTSISQAQAELQTVSQSKDEAAFEAIDRLERKILDHVPESPPEAAVMLDVVIPDVAAGGRSDGRDVKALEEIRSFLIQAPKDPPC